MVLFDFFLKKDLRYGTFFGSISAAVTLDTPLPDTQGVYAATENGKLSLVVVNKNPDTPIAFSFENVPPGNYFLRHFGGEAGVAKWQVRYPIYVFITEFSAYSCVRLRRLCPI